MIGSSTRDRDVLSLESFLLSLCFFMVGLWVTSLGRLSWCDLLLFRWTLAKVVNDGLWMSMKPQLPLGLLVQLFSLILDPCKGMA